ncbi:MAG TPA: nitronate monooxygenase, partial [Dysgonamonadaceae bacterium]|nr:nitronate monooxygenase [Dysgonamonadaceae bacterium]
GGIGSGAAMAAAFALGAEGVQVGTRFALTVESSASEAFKQKCISISEGDTMLALKKIAPTRLIRNEFYEKVKEMEDRGASKEELQTLLGHGRAKKGIFEGDLDEGELEIGQIASSIRQIVPAAQVVSEMIEDFNRTVERLKNLSF